MKKNPTKEERPDDPRAARLRAAREAAGYRYAADAYRELRTKFGWDWSEGLYRHHENGTRSIPHHAAVAYEKAFRGQGLKAADIYSEGELLTPSTSDQAADFVEEGVISMGLWHDSTVESALKKGRRNRKSNATLRKMALVDDDSVDLAIYAGEYALYEPQSGTEGLLDGSLVLVERRRGKLVQRSIRRYVLKPDGTAHLIVHSKTTKADRLDMPSKEAQDVVKIIGRVVGKIVEFD